MRWVRPLSIISIFFLSIVLTPLVLADCNGEPGPPCPPDLPGTGSLGDLCVPSNDGVEICDGLDNNCNEQIDEGGVCDVCTSGTVETKDCGNNTGECVYGSQNRTCVSGQWADWSECTGGTGPVAEICDGKDNDCDGQTDTADTDLYLPLASLQNGSCGGATKECVDGNLTEPDYTLHYASYVVTETDAYCEGEDNDCDGQTDELCACTSPGITQVCGPSINAYGNGTAFFGVCGSGVQVCQDNFTWGDCTNATYPSTEICDGFDNDCDNSTDTNDTNLFLPAADKIFGVCSGAKKICVDGNLTEPDYSAIQHYSSEVCDNYDNDCDNRTNEGGVCTSEEDNSGGSSSGGGSSGGGGGSSGGYYPPTIVEPVEENETEEVVNRPNIPNEREDEEVETIPRVSVPISWRYDGDIADGRVSSPDTVVIGVRGNASFVEEDTLIVSSSSKALEKELPKEYQLYEFIDFESTSGSSSSVENASVSFAITDASLLDSLGEVVLLEYVNGEWQETELVTVAAGEFTGHLSSNSLNPVAIAFKDPSVTFVSKDAKSKEKSFPLLLVGIIFAVVIFGGGGFYAWHAGLFSSGALTHPAASSIGASATSNNVIPAHEQPQLSSSMGGSLHEMHQEVNKEESKQGTISSASSVVSKESTTHPSASVQSASLSQKPTQKVAFAQPQISPAQRQALTSFIEVSKKKGFTDDQIKTRLLSAGWKKEVVEILLP